MSHPADSKDQFKSKAINCYPLLNIHLVEFCFYELSGCRLESRFYYLKILVFKINRMLATKKSATYALKLLQKKGLKK